jgi:hypothetical protein
LYILFFLFLKVFFLSSFVSWNWKHLRICTCNHKYGIFYILVFFLFGFVISVFFSYRKRNLIQFYHARLILLDFLWYFLS